jgi:cell wall-associated NlpC family hydrolase
VSSGRRVRRGAAIAALASAVALVSSIALAPVPAVASHGGGPSAAAVARSNHEVASREREVRVAATAVGKAKAELANLRVSAEVAFEAYDGAKVKLVAANHAMRTAHLVLAGATHQVTSGKAKVVAFATASYETGGGLASLETYLQPGGASQLVSRLGAMNAIASSEHTTLEQLDAAQIYQGVVSRQTEVIAANATAAAAVANRAKLAALAAVKKQTDFVTGLRAQQAHLRTLLGRARTRASKLARARLEAIARARAAAAAAAARAAAQSHTSSSPSPYSGESGSTAGTVSAQTALTALHDAESQIGKPYQWGAAGPNTYDCSGLVMWAYDQVGVHMDHFTGDQWNEGAHVSRADLRPGDLVFFATNTSDASTIHHVGMYVGGDEMVDAPFTGVDVRYDSIDRPDYIGAVRPYQR